MRPCLSGINDPVFLNGNKLHSIPISREREKERFQNLWLKKIFIGLTRPSQKPTPQKHKCSPPSLYFSFFSITHPQ
jgi:hypothetical protein